MNKRKKEIEKIFNTLNIEPKIIDLSSSDGFMVFSQETYTEQELSKFKNKDKFTKYPYKHRYFASYKISNSDNNNSLTFILYNSSYANPEEKDDSISNCIELAKKYSYSTVEIVNLFSLRQTTSKMKDLNDTNNINKQFLKEYISSIKNEKDGIVLAWGYGKELKLKDYINEIYDWMKNCKHSFLIGVDTDEVNNCNHQTDKGVLNGVGGFKNIAILKEIKQ